MDDVKILQMLQVCDSLFPIGAFTLSNGMEALVQNNLLQTADCLETYVRNYLKILPYNELGAASLAFRAGTQEDLIRLDELLSAARGPYELRMGSRKLCRRFLKMQEKLQPAASVSRYAELIQEYDLTGSYGMAMGLYIKDHAIDLEQGLLMYTYSLISAVVVNAVKLIPLSQMDGQNILHRMFPDIEEAAAKAQNCTEEEVGIGGPEFDISSMEHEILYSRMYIS